MPDQVTRRMLSAVDVDASFKCPECESNVKVTLGDWAAGKTVKCQKGHAIKLEGKDAKTAKKALDDLEKTIKSFGK